MRCQTVPSTARVAYAVPQSCAARLWISTPEHAGQRCLIKYKPDILKTYPWSDHCESIQGTHRYKLSRYGVTASSAS